MNTDQITQLESIETQLMQLISNVEDFRTKGKLRIVKRRISKVLNNEFKGE